MAVKELLEKFHQIASSPKKQLESYLEAGEQVVLCAPVYTPEEIIHSMGLIPMGVWGADMEVKEAKRYFPAFVCSIMQSILELGMTGELNGVSALLVPSLCDSLKCLGQNWKYAVKEIPMIPMTYPQNRKQDFGKEFTKAGYLRVVKDLQDVTGAVFTEEKLAESIKVYNEHNRVMREISDVLANHPELTASQRSDIFKSAYFMKKEEHTALVLVLLKELKETPVPEIAKLKIVTTGILADNKELLKIIDNHGLMIAADDVAHESRQYRTDTAQEGCPMEALADKFSRMDNCSVLYDREKKRADHIVNLVKKHQAAGVAVILTKFCDPEEFDYVLIKKACDLADIPVIQIEVDRQMIHYEQAGTMIQTWKDML